MRRPNGGGISPIVVLISTLLRIRGAAFPQASPPGERKVLTYVQIVGSVAYGGRANAMADGTANLQVETLLRLWMGGPSLRRALKLTGRQTASPND